MEVILVNLAVLVALPAIYSLARTNPERAFLVWLFLTPLSIDRLSFGGLEIPFSNCFDRLGMMALFLGLYQSGRLREVFPGRFSKFEKANLAFILVFLAEGCITIHPHDAYTILQEAADAFAIPFSFYFLTKYLLTRDGVYHEEFEDRLVKVLTLVGGYLAIMSIFEGITLHDLFPKPASRYDSSHDGLRLELGSPRTNASFYDPEILGQYLSLILLLTVYRFRIRQMHRPAGVAGKFKLMIYSGMMAVGLYYNKFRTFWMVLLGGLASRYLFVRKGRTLFLLVVVTAVLGFAIFWGQFTSSKIYNERVANTESAYSRISAWLYAFRAFSEHPLTGIGYGRLMIYINHAHEMGDDMRFGDAYASFSPHHTLISVLAENGILGAIPLALMAWYFVGIVFSCLREGRTPEDREFAVFAVAAAFAILFPQNFDRMFLMRKATVLMFVVIGLIAAGQARMKGEVAREGEMTEEMELAEDAEAGTVIS